MRVAKLTVHGTQVGEEVSLELNDLGSLSSGTMSLADLVERIVEGKATGDDIAARLPQEILRALRQWYHDGGTSGVLAIVSKNPALDMLPWERVPHSIGMPLLCIVRVLYPSADVPAPSGDNTLLAAGWVGAPTLNLFGIQKELAALSGLGMGAHLRVLAEPTIPDLVAACIEDHPRCVHIAAPAIEYHASGPRVGISGTTALEWVPLSILLDGLVEARVNLVVINTCDGAFGGSEPSAARLVTERLHATTVSWYGPVDDLEAADFASFFYSRVIEGDTALEGIRRFNEIRPLAVSPDRPMRDIGAAQSRHRAAVPVLWASSIDALTMPPFGDLGAPALEGAAAKGPSAVVLATDEPGTVSIDFEPQRWLNPALLKNQRPAITRLVLTSDKPLRGVGVSIACDTGAGQSVVSVTRDLARGPQPLAVDDLHFPVLYPLIDGGAGRRWVNFTVRCMHRGTLIAETTRSVLWMGLSEWLDRKDMWHYIPAFVDPYGDGVLKVLDEANGVLKTHDPTAAFDGYQSGEARFVQRQAEAIFCCLRDAPFELSYIDVPPLNVYLPDESMPTGQRVRTPTQVIEHRRGTCHDLAILFASCLEHVGICSLVLLMPGHTYTGYWTDLNAWRQFWERAEQDRVRLQAVAGRSWIVRDVNELTALADAEQVVLFEATRVTNRNATFGESLKAGRANLTEGFDVAIDVRASRRFIQPI